LIQWKIWHPQLTTPNSSMASTRNFLRKSIPVSRHMMLHTERRNVIENGSFTGVLMNKPAYSNWKYPFLSVVKKQGDHFGGIGSIYLDRAIRQGIGRYNKTAHDDHYMEQFENVESQWTPRFPYKNYEKKTIRLG
jgi:hypothetical protein